MGRRRRAERRQGAGWLAGRWTRYLFGYAVIVLSAIPLLGFALDPWHQRPDESVALAVGLAAHVVLARFYARHRPDLGILGERLLGAVLLTTGFRSVALNLNPLIRLDGYYVLVDLLELPNLRLRASEVIGWRLARWAGRGAGDAEPAEAVRERRLLEAYGWLSLAYIAALLTVPTNSGP